MDVDGADVDVKDVNVAGDANVAAVDDHDVDADVDDNPL